MLTALFVAARIIANPVANVFQKQLTQRSADPLFIVGATHALLTLMSLPLLFALTDLGRGGEFWTYMLTAALLAVAGNVLLVYALKWADLSVLGPINAYKSVISLVLAVFLVGEVPTPMGVLGVLLILAGSYLVVGDDPIQPRRNTFVQFFRERGIRLRVAALVLSATEAVFLKKALLLSSPLTTFVLWSILGLPIAAVATVSLNGDRIESELPRFRDNYRAFFSLAIATGLMQLATLFTFSSLQVGYSLALFQLSAVISVVLGRRYFQERNFRKRLVGSAVMAAGAALIVALGSRG
jgi:drug/metabolite transporter (DMT)-like permease